MPYNNIGPINTASLSNKVKLNDGTTNTYGEIVKMFKRTDKKELLKLAKKIPDIFFAGEKITMLERLLQEKNATVLIEFAIDIMNCNVDIANSEDLTVLFGAVNEDEVEVAKLLLARGANVNYTSSLYGTTPVWEVKSFAMFELLLSNGADLNLPLGPHDDNEFSGSLAEHIITNMENDPENEESADLIIRKVETLVPGTKVGMIRKELKSLAKQMAASNDYGSSNEEQQAPFPTFGFSYLPPSFPEYVEGQEEVIVQGIINDTEFNRTDLKNYSFFVLKNILENHDMRLFVKALKAGANINDIENEDGADILDLVLPTDYLRTKIILQNGSTVVEGHIYRIFDMKTYELMKRYGMRDNGFFIKEHLERDGDRIEPVLVKKLKEVLSEMKESDKDRSQMYAPGLA